MKRSMMDIEKRVGVLSVMVGFKDWKFYWELQGGLYVCFGWRTFAKKALMEA